MIGIPASPCELHPIYRLGNSQEASRFPGNVLPFSVGPPIAFHHGDNISLPIRPWFSVAGSINHKQLDHGGVGIHVDCPGGVTLGFVPVIGGFPALDDVNLHQAVGFEGPPVDNCGF